MVFKGNGKKRGRPLGLRLSEESKRAISESKRGQTHKQSTKDKISSTLITYFRKLRPLSEEMENRYCDYGDDVCNWLNEVRDELNSIVDIRTERSMRDSRRNELNYGGNIEYLCHHITPELLLLFKEHCEINNISIEEVLDNM